MGRLVFLVDTNIWLETLLDQERSAQTGAFLKTLPGNAISISEFSLYSIGVITDKLGQDDLFDEFLTDTLDHAGIARIRLDRSGWELLLQAKDEFDLDFDDAYQYAAARSRGLELVSFDDDFDATDIPRVEPQQALDRFEASE